MIEHNKKDMAMGLDHDSKLNDNRWREILHYELNVAKDETKVNMPKLKAMICYHWPTDTSLTDDKTATTGSEAFSSASNSVGVITTYNNPAAATAVNAVTSKTTNYSNITTTTNDLTITKNRRMMNNKTTATATTGTAKGTDSTLDNSKIGKCDIVSCNVTITSGYLLYKCKNTYNGCKRWCIIIHVAISTTYKMKEMKWM